MFNVMCDVMSHFITSHHITSHHITSHQSHVALSPPFSHYFSCTTTIRTSFLLTRQVMNTKKDIWVNILNFLVNSTAIFDLIVFNYCVLQAYFSITWITWPPCQKLILELTVTLPLSCFQVMQSGNIIHPLNYLFFTLYWVRIELGLGIVG